MPTVGDICKSNSIGLKGHDKYIWQPCSECGKERWINIYQWKRGRARLCHPCHMKICHNRWLGDRQKGSGNPRWNGGRRIRSADGYVAVKFLQDDPYYEALKPMMMVDGYILEHRLVMAKSLGRYLHSWEIVHHRDGARDNNKLENLEITTRGEHLLSYADGYRQGYHDGLTAIGSAVFTINPGTGEIDVHRIQE